MSVKSKEQRFKDVVDLWVRADLECRDTYIAWQQACERRIKLAETKNAAWKEVVEARNADDNEERHKQQE
jgi:hypothetical protein